MKGIKSIELLKNPGTVRLNDIPMSEYDEFFRQTVTLLGKDGFHCLNYFTVRMEGRLNFYMLVANDEAHKVLIYGHSQPADVKELASLTAECFPLHVFEREIAENEGITFKGNPWAKPLRYPYNRADRNALMKDYPFYNIDSEETHQVGVGPVHAGIIEPGHFRFHCHGERVLHLEIQLGYQHRGVEDIMLSKETILQRAIISEDISGDTAVGHSTAFAGISESLAGKEPCNKLKIWRTIALEMERMAVHIGDTAALCGDVAYQIGQVTCEALRTMVINSMQDWCGNRFGKRLIRPGGSNFPLTNERAEIILKTLGEVRHRFLEVTDLIYNDSGIIARFENTGTLSVQQARLAGAVGMAARSSGLHRDIRKSHPSLAYSNMNYSPALLDGGDVLARGMLRKMEVELSYKIIEELIMSLMTNNETVPAPDYNLHYGPELMAVSLVEGWRGEICHCALTDTSGRIVKYKVKDPSLHNWTALALAVRNQEISDFPVCNKSFNLSYCGNDL